MKRACERELGCYDFSMEEKEIAGRKIGYMRVSDRDQSEALQLDALKSAGCAVIYTDRGISGATRTRRGLDELLEDLQSGDTLVVWKLDRLGRSTIHLLQLLGELHERGIDFQALTQGIDTTTAIGRLLYGQLAVFAEFERECISERTKAGMAVAKARGGHVGRPKIITIEQAKACARRIASGTITAQELAQELDVSPQTLHRAISALI